MTCDEKWILYDNWRWPAQWLDWEEASKHLPKPNLHQKNFTIIVWWTAAHLIHYSFWILAKLLHWRSILGKLMGCIEYWSCHWSTEFAHSFSTTMLDHMSNNKCFKSQTNCIMKFCFICHVHLTSHQLITMPSILTAFCRENAFTTSRRQKILAKFF